MNLKRVHIFGGAGSGKTTLAKAYSKRFGISHHELDDIYYLHAAQRKKRQVAERDKLVTDVVSGETWIVDGIFWQPWVRPPLVHADKIIVLAIPEFTRHIRVIKRHFQLLSQASPSD
ncbi:MAG: hypothetical protein AAF512_05260 [Pseudomonadota bacterium]